MKKYDQHIWNALFSVLFLVVALSVYLTLGGERFSVQWLYRLGVLDLTIMALAVFRLIRLVTFDKIFSFVRVWFFNDAGQPRYQYGPLRTIAELIECIWCTGAWAALLVMGLYVGMPFGRFIVLVLAISAVGTFLQNLSRKLAS